MKYALAVATEDALPSAFVVFRGLAESVKKAAALGYDGIEVALKNADQVDRKKTVALLVEHSIKMTAISTGQIASGMKAWFTHPEPEVRGRAEEIFRKVIDLASDFGAKVNVGRVRGSVAAGENREDAEARFLEIFDRVAAYAEGRGVSLLLEPINRYEINYINSVDEAGAVLAKLGRKNVQLVPDVFHMNIEEDSLAACFVRNIARVGSLHFADSNRLAPGWGHLNFPEILSTLRALKYDGWATVEILPKPDPDAAAVQAIRYLRAL